MDYINSNITFIIEYQNCGYEKERDKDIIIKD